MRPKTISSLISLFTIVILIAGYAPAATSQTIKVGAFAPFSGESAEYGSLFKEGFEMAIDHINKEGGANGRKIELVYRDDRNDPNQGAIIAREFVADKSILAVIGAQSSLVALAAAPVFQEGGLLLISPTSSHVKLTQIGDYIFRNINMQSQEVPFVLSYGLKKLNAKRLAILVRLDDYGQAARETYEKMGREVGAEIVVVESFVAADTVDFRPFMTKLRQSKADVLLTAIFAREGGLIARQLKQAGFQAGKDIYVLSQTGLFNPTFLKTAGPAADGWFVNSNFSPKSTYPPTQEFVKEFKKRYNREPDQFGALAYDCLGMVVEAIRKAPDLSRTSVKDEMAKIRDFPAVAGKTSFDKNRNIDRAMIMLKVVNGEFVPAD